MEIKYLIWDFDGVLCDSKTEAFKVHNYLCKNLKVFQRSIMKMIMQN